MRSPFLTVVLIFANIAAIAISAALWYLFDLAGRDFCLGFVAGSIFWHVADAWVKGDWR